MKRLILTIVLMALIATPALANITIGPGDGDYYTRQTWTFDTDPCGNPPYMGVPPDSGNGNSASADIYIDGFPPGFWLDTLSDGRQGGMWGQGVRIDLWIDNTIDPRLTKIVQVEADYLVQAGSSGGYVAGYSVLHGDPLGVNDLYFPLSAPVTGDPGDWQEVTIEWQIPQNYDLEVICLKFVDSGVTIDKVDAATICIPEPATIAMLGLGALSLLRRRKNS